MESGSLFSYSRGAAWTYACKCACRVPGASSWREQSTSSKGWIGTARDCTTAKNGQNCQCHFKRKCVLYGKIQTTCEEKYERRSLTVARKVHEIAEVFIHVDTPIDYYLTAANDIGYKNKKR